MTRTLTPRAAGLGVLIGGLLLTAMATAWQARHNKAHAASEFDALSRMEAQRIQERMAVYEDALRGTRGAVLAAGLERSNDQTFHDYAASRDSAREFPGARGFGVIRRIPADAEAAFVAVQRRSGRPNFAVRSFRPHDGDRYVVESGASHNEDSRGIGLDIASEQTRRATAIAAARSGQPTLTPPITLAIASGQPLQSFLLLLPIYRPGSGPASTSAEASVYGWSYVAIIGSQALGDYDFNGHRFTLTLRDRDSARGNPPFFDSHPGSRAASGLAQRVPIEVYGRAWEAELRATPDFIEALGLRDPRLVAAGGAALSMLLALLAGLQARSSQRSRELRIAQVHDAAIVEASNDAIVAASLDGCIVSWNPAAQRLFGHTPEQAIGQPLQILLPEGAQAKGIETLVYRIARAEFVAQFDTVRCRRDGTLIDVSVSAVPLIGAQGRVVGIAKTLRDISAQKAAERQLREFSASLEAEVAARTAELERSRRHLQILFDALPSMIGYWDGQLVNRFANKAYHDWFGAAPGTLPGTHLAALLGPERFALSRPHAQAALRGEARTFERSQPRPDGDGMRHTLVHYLPETIDGRVSGFYVLVNDLTELTESRRRADAANLAKSRFLANMSHEIRTPMNAVIGLTYLLGQTPLGREQAATLGKIELASKSLLGVINDILDVSKIEAGELAMEDAEFHLPGLLSGLAQVAQVQTQAKQIGFALELPAALPDAFRGDALRLNQVLQNLLTNAIKFTHRGGVRLVVRLVEPQAAPEHVGLRFEVHDSGIGIAPEMARTLFQPFAQADASTTRRFGGTGLGLSIVKQLVGMMGGRVGLQSQPGRGSQFWVELSLRRGDAQALALAQRQPPRAEAGQRQLDGVRVLVVDDSQINLEVARRILELEGARVGVAADGQAAVDRLCAEPQAFDIVLMDVQMPVLDGLAATRLIRSEPRLHRLPVIALTAGALSSQRNEAVAAGMDDFIGKPFEPQAVIDSIHRLVPRPAQPPALAAAPVVETKAAAGSASWLAIDGIEAADVLARIGNDAKLFRALLSHLLDEFADLRPTDLATLKARMHKLRGSAGNVGAQALRSQASAVEDAAARGDATAAERELHRLVRQLTALRRSADAAWAQQPTSADEGTAGSAEVQPHDLTRLVAMLRQQQVAALDQFEALSAELRRRLADERYVLLRGHIDSLRFREAAELMETEGLGG